MLVYMWASQDKTFGPTVAKTMVNGDVVFTVSGGPIRILELISICVTTNTTASTMQWQSVPTVGTATTFSGASASLATATAGTTLMLAHTALSTAPTPVLASAGGVQLGSTAVNRITIKDGTIKLVIGVGTTDGTWQHAIRYQPLTTDSIING